MDAQSASSVESIESAASAAWDAVSASAPPETPVPAETPAAEPATNAAPVEEAKVETAPTAVEGTNPEKVAAEPTSYDKWVAKYGDPVKAADAAWETNNRASELARKVQELEAKLTQPAVSNTPEAVAEPIAPVPAPVVEAAPEQVDQWVDQQVAQDPTCIAWHNAYVEKANRLQVLADPANPESHHAAAKEVQKLQNWLLFPQVAEDPYQVADVKRQLTEARAEYQARKLEAQGLDLENRDIRAQFEARKGQYRSQINAHYEQQREAAKAAQEYQQTITRHAQDLEKAWPVALDRTIKENQIPEPLVAKFTKSLRTAAMAHLESGLSVDQIDTFMANEAKEFMSNLDAFHRLKSGEYARQATQRAASPAPVPSVVPQVQPSDTSDPIAAIEERAALALRQYGFAR